MTRAEKILTSHLLDMAAREFHEHGCNDMDLGLFKGFKEKEVAYLVAGFNAWNRGRGWDEDIPLENISDDHWMEYLSAVVLKEAK